MGGFCIIVALAMGEIASTYPTAGGLYYWASKLGGPAWGWFTGWFNLVGQIAVTAAIGYGCAVFTTSLLNLLFDYPNTIRWILFTYGMILFAAGLINMLKVPITAMLNSISAWWHMVGVLVFVAVLVIVPDTHKSAGFVFGETLNNTGFSGMNRQHRFLLRVPDGPPDGPVHDHWVRRFRAHERGDQTGVAGRCLGHRHVGRGLGDLRIHPVDGRDVRVAQRDERRLRRCGTADPHVLWTTAMSEKAGPSSCS